MNQIERMTAQLNAMKAQVAASSAAQRKAAIEDELSRQSPNAPDIVRRLAVAELGSADEVSDFLASESVKPLVSEQSAGDQSKGERPNLKTILSDIKNNGGRFGFGR